MERELKISLNADQLERWSQSELEFAFKALRNTTAALMDALSYECFHKRIDGKFIDYTPAGHTLQGLVDYIYRAADMIVEHTQNCDAESLNSSDLERRAEILIRDALECGDSAADIAVLSVTLAKAISDKKTLEKHAAA